MEQRVLSFYNLNMYISDVFNLLNNPDHIPCEPNSIILTECAVEAYSNRLLFIGLRIKGAQYRQAVSVILRNNIKENCVLPKAMQMIDKVKAEEFKKIDSINKLKVLYENFSLPCRNNIAHGKKGGYPVEIINLCIQINLAYIRELENKIKVCFGHSVLDPPSQWGAKKCMKALTDKQIYDLEFKGNKNPWDYEKAKKKFEVLNL